MAAVQSINQTNLHTQIQPLRNEEAYVLASRLSYSVVDPDPEPGAFLIHGSGMGKKSRSGSGMNNLDHISDSLETIFWD
jgi:hypothetical protein